MPPPPGYTFAVLTNGGSNIEFKSIDSGQVSVCGFQKADNALRCWGQPEVLLPPAELFDPDTEQFSTISQGIFSSCGLIKGGDDAGKARCWNVHGHVTTVPDDLANTPFTDITVGRRIACGLLKDGSNAGEVRCWGRDTYGEITEAPADSANIAFSSISAGGAHVCGLKSDKRVMCWGATVDQDDPSKLAGNYGQTDIPGNLTTATFASIDTGYFNVCGILDGQGSQTAGTLRCWGAENFDTAVGRGTLRYYSDFNTGMNTPYESRDPMPTLATTPGSISAGRYNTCARTAAGKTVCLGGYTPYGYNDMVKAVVTGNTTTCIIKTDGKVRCRGSNNYNVSGGNSDYGDSSTPPELDTLTFSSIALGLFHACGILDDQNEQTARRQARCWGWNTVKQAPVPDALANSTFAAVAAGTVHTCGLLDGDNDQTAGQLHCWGIDSNNQGPQYALYQHLDFGQTTIPTMPVNLTTKTYASVRSGDFHTCAITDGQGTQTAGQVHCWGRNTTSSPTHRQTPPSPPSPPAPIIPAASPRHAWPSAGASLTQTSARPPYRPGTGTPTSPPSPPQGSTPAP